MTTSPPVPPPPKSKKLLGIIRLVVGVLLLICCVCGIGVALVLQHRAQTAVNDLPSEASVEPVTSGPMGIDNLHKHLPADIPIYTGAQRGGVVSGIQNGNEVQFTTLITSDKLTTVSAFYKSNMATHGWKNNNTKNIPNGIHLSYTKGNRQVVLNLNDDSTNQTVIMILIVKAKTQP